MSDATHALYMNGVTLLTSGSDRDCKRWVTTLCVRLTCDFPDWYPSAEDPRISLALVEDVLYEVHPI